MPIELPDLDSVFVYAVHIRNKFRGITQREGVLWQGSAGWTEFSPFWDYDAVESQTWLRAAIAAAEAPYPERRRDSIPINCTIPAVGPDRAQEIVRTSDGCRTAKIKVAEPGQDLRQDLDRVAAVRDALGADGKIRVDANGLWSAADAIDALGKLDKAAGGLEYAEQPTASVEDLAHVRRKVGVPIAADESIRRAEDPMRVVALEAADIAVLKVQPLGGIQATLDIAAQIGLPVVISSALETSIGIQASIAAAAALPTLSYACGLNTVTMFTADSMLQPLVAHNGAIALNQRLVPDNLAAIEADGETRQRWLDRLRAVASA